MTLRLGWFTAGRGPGSRAMFERTLTAIDNGSLDASIEFVFMHREPGEGEGSDVFRHLATARGIPVHALSSLRFRAEHGNDLDGHREEYDRGVLDLVGGHEANVCVLAGYLLILSPLLNAAFNFINLHGALPHGPIGLWQSVIWQLIDQRASESGVMTFAVTDDLDRGPPLTYCRFGLRGPAFDPLWEQIAGANAASLREEKGEQHPLFQAIRAEGLRREPLLLVETLRSIAMGTLPADGSNPEAVDLTAHVDTALADPS